MHVVIIIEDHVPFLSSLGRQPFHGSNSDELVFSVCHGTADMKFVNSVTKEDVMKVSEAIIQLLQKSPKFRLANCLWS